MSAESELEPGSGRVRAWWPAGAALLTTVIVAYGLQTRPSLQTPDPKPGLVTATAPEPVPPDPLEEPPPPEDAPISGLAMLAISAWTGPCDDSHCKDRSPAQGMVSVRDELGEIARPQLEGETTVELELPPGDYIVALLDPKTHVVRTETRVTLTPSDRVPAALWVRSTP